MSEKLLALVKSAAAVLKKVDQHLEAMVKLSTNANMQLEFGTEGTKALYQLVVMLQKKGAKGSTVGEYKHSDIPKFIKEIQATKTRLADSIKANNNAVKQAEQFLKLTKVLDAQVGEIAKEKGIATNGAAIKMLVDVRKNLVGIESALKDVVAFSPISTNQTKFIDVTEKTKVDDLKSKLPMAFQAAMSDWEKAGAKITTQKTGIRKNNFDTSLKLAAQLAAAG
jgi:hypothetical protein